MSDKLRVGNIIKQGELLAQIEKSEFKIQAAEAKNRVAAAKIDLLKEELEAGQAHRNWKQSKIRGIRICFFRSRVCPPGACVSIHL
jgi:multidrug resistance efflux pump